MLRPCRPLRVDHLPPCEVRAADISDLALTDDIVQRAQRLFDRSSDVREVDLVEVYPVGPEAAKAALNRIEDVPARGAPVQRPFTHRTDEFRRDNDILASVSQRCAQELLAARTAVDVRCIEERYAKLERAVNDGRGLVLVDPHAEVVAAEARNGNLETGTPDVSVFHRPALGLDRYRQVDVLALNLRHYPFCGLSVRLNERKARSPHLETDSIEGVLYARRIAGGGHEDRHQRQ